MPQPSILSHSELDSRRFGLVVMRATLDKCEPRALAAEVLASGCDIAILRLPAGASSRMAELSRWSLPILHADTLVYYRCDLTRLEPAALRNGDLRFSIAAEGDTAELRPLIAATFADYRSHYHANPLLARDLILAGYQEWAENHMRGPGNTLWIARRDGKLVAFAACHRHDDGDDEGVLYGVAPDSAGAGIYGDLIRHTQAMAKQGGARSMKVSTQVDNFAVQKVWAREGFHMFEALDTFHVNALLSTGEVLTDRNLEFSADQIARFAEVSGDTNPVHLDAAAARAAGFPAQIAHGVMALAELSRILGTESPGAGTIISHFDIAYLRPLVAGLTYHLTARIPGGIRDKVPMLAVAQIRDAAGLPCMIARAAIVLRC